MNTYRQRFKTLKERFEERIERIPECGCWIWLGSTSVFGYGKLCDQKSKEQLAHRISWILHFGKIPDSFCVLHRCDTPACVNPYHLFIGTKLDNNRDRENKGRGNGFTKLIGETNKQAKLTNNDVLNIRQSFEKTKVLAAKYKVGRTTIQNVRSGKYWKNI